jgi:hypothetical protein
MASLAITDAIIQKMRLKCQTFAKSMSNTLIPHPLSELPNHISGSSGLSLIRDYSSRCRCCSSVYFINRTTDIIQLKSGISQPFVKLEFESSPNVWIRAEPHIYSDCGIPYYDPPPLEPDNFFYFEGYLPIYGSHAKLRYSFYDQSIELASQSFSGFVNPGDVSLAQYDALAFKVGTIEFAAKVAAGGYKAVPLANNPDPRYYAINRLGALATTKPEAATVLEEIVISGELPFAEFAMDYVSVDFIEEIAIGTQPTLGKSGYRHPRHRALIKLQGWAKSSPRAMLVLERVAAMGEDEFSRGARRILEQLVGEPEKEP